MDMDKTAKATTDGFDWSTIITDVGIFVNAAAPLVEAADPGLAPAIAMGERIIQGAIAEVPSAVALYKTFTSGGTPTPEQLATFNADYEVSYQQLRTDLAGKMTG